ncbi:gamma-glutamylcyclotransferase family protein [Actinokineospora sp. G85]|uniref:gamma-glutamylcyclotransferase family protein n=1 Tax=Actinokineospora sp. G85 TaxID=3406626 RepID=UPI003C75A507
MFADHEFPANPYPGARPPYSFAHHDDGGVRIGPDPAALAGWRAGGDDLDHWLAARGGPPMADRVPVLGYGSNPCPSKIAWMRASLGLRGPVVVLRARCTGLGAVWAWGRRVVDDQRPAVLAAVDGVEDHAVLMLTPDQVAVFDVCEGRGRRYDLARVRGGTVELVDAPVVVRGPLAYVGASEIRRPLLVHDHPVRCAEVPQAEAIGLVGRPARADGLDAEPIGGAPSPMDFPAALFVYGTLRPGEPAWPLLSPLTHGEPHRATLPGALYDTGQGFPALTLDEGEVHGWVVPLRPGADLTTLDEYEGVEYRRVRVVVGGEWVWAYVWVDPVAGMALLPGRWELTG